MTVAGGCHFSFATKGLVSVWLLSVNENNGLHTEGGGGGGCEQHPLHLIGEFKQGRGRGWVGHITR